MRIKSLFLLFTIALGYLGNNLFAQIHYTAIPRDFAIVPRDVKTNTAVIAFKGTVSSASYNTVRFLTYQNGKRIQDQTQMLIQSSGVADFNYKIKLKAGKFHYDFKIIFYGIDSIVKVIKDVAIGDIIIIQGQSNAVANQYFGSAEPQYLDSFLRSFGTSAFNGTTATDTFWYTAKGNTYYNKGCIGQWALVLGKKILDSFGIPLGIMNGAIGGTSVSQHQRNKSQPNTLSNIYGRLLYRMQKAGVDKNVRSIMFFQGESDGQFPAFHDSLFRILYKDWFTDYKGMEQNYFVQVRTGGCGSPTPAFSEVQRQFEFTLNKLKVISTNGLNGHDGCHYGFVNGYELLGKQIFALAGRDLYNSGRMTNIDPPNISQVHFNNSALSEIVLTMKQPNDSIFVDANFYNQFYINGDNAVTVVGGFLKNNKVHLTLSKGTCLPITLTYFSRAGNQPWVKNKIGSGLIGFNKVLIQRPIIKPAYSGCPGVSFNLGEDSIPGYNYKWIRLKDGSTFTTSRIKVNLKTDDAFIAIVYFKNNFCKPDTFEVTASIDKTLPLVIGNDTILCNGNTWTNTVPSTFSSIQWKQHNRTESGYQFQTDTAGKVYASAKTTLGCIFQDSVNIITSNPKIKFAGPYLICPGLDTMIYVSNKFTNYFWNGIKINQNYHRAKTGKLILQVEDSLGCTASDTTEVHEFTPVKNPLLTYSICLGDSILVPKPNSFQNWFFNGNILPKYINKIAPSIDSIILQDSNFCLYNNTINILAKDLPAFSLGRDTSVCPGQKVKIKCNYYTHIYEWNGIRESSNSFITDLSGKYTCKIKNTEGCTYTDTIQIFNYLKPNIFIPSDTTICDGSLWTPYLQKEYKWLLNGNPTKDLTLSLAGTYNFTAINNYNCSAVKSSNLYTIKCINSNPITSNEKISIHPNPSTTNRILIQGNLLPHSNWQILDMAGNEIIQGNFIRGYEIDISILPNGLYIMKGKDFFGKFIKSN